MGNSIMDENPGKKILTLPLPNLQPHPSHLHVRGEIFLKKLFYANIHTSK